MVENAELRKNNRPDALSRIPRYIQVATALRHRINGGQWPIGKKIATLEQLEKEFQVARVTIRQAVDVLRQEGLLKSEQGRGTFVTKAPTPVRWLQLATQWNELISPIKRNTLKHLPIEQDHPPRLDSGDGDPADSYTYIYTLQSRDDEPYALARVHVATDIYDLAPQAFKSRVALAVLAELEDVDVAHAHQTLSVGSADVYAAVHLRLSFGAPIVEARIVASDANDRVIYVGEVTYRGDVVRINIELTDDGRKVRPDEDD